jgi:hypothetical protein
MTWKSYLDSVALAIPLTSSPIENQSIVDAASLTSATDTVSCAANSTVNVFAWMSETTYPNMVDWPAASAGDPYELAIDVNSIGADLTLPNGGTGGPNYAGMLMTDSTGATAEVVAGPAWDSNSGTGIKKMTDTAANPALGTATNRMICTVGVTNANAHSSQNLILNLGTTSTYMVGPFTGGGTDYTSTVTGTLNFVGSTPRHAISRVLTASTSFVGRWLLKTMPLHGTLSFVGSATRPKMALTRATTVGTLLFVGAQARQFGRSLSGSLSFSGSITRRAIGRVLTAASSFVTSLQYVVPPGSLGDPSLRAIFIQQDANY